MSCCNSNCNHDPCGSSFNQALTRAAQYAQYAQTQANKAEDLWLEFNALYLGAFAVAPTQDNQGNPLQVGALYWNTGSNTLYAWSGLTWVTDTNFNELSPFLSTGSTTPRNLATRMADVVNVKDFGAVGDGVTNNYTAILNAINYAATNGKTVYFPGPGTYNLSPAITVPSNVKVNLASNTNVPRNNFIINGIFYRDGISPEGDSSAFGRYFHYKTTSSETANANEYNFGKIDIIDSVSMVGSSGSKVNGLDVTHNFGGPNSSGGRHAINGRLLHGYGGPATQGPPNPATTDRNYVGTVGQVLTDAWEGGTVSSPKGGFFGINAYAGASGNSTYIFNLTSGEFNTSIATGDVNRVYYHSGIQIASEIGTRGTFVDAAISVSNLGGPNGWKNGILMGAQNGRHALDADSTAIKINSPHNTTIDVTGIIVPTIINHNALVVRVDGDQNAILDLGKKTVNNSCQINFFCNSSIGSPSSRIASGSTGAIALQTQVAVIDAVRLQPQSDNVTQLGVASSRWTEVFAINGAINTSDGRNKQQVRTITDQEKAVATKLKSLIRAYKWNDAVEFKGENARIHFGVIAQDVKNAFEEEGLNADEYGIFCYDEWEAVEDEKDFEGNVIISGREAGNSYGVRYNELTMFILANL